MASGAGSVQLIDMLRSDCFPMADVVLVESGVGVMPGLDWLKPLIVRRCVVAEIV